MKESTYVKYFTSIEKHIKPKLGSCSVQALSSLRVEEFSRTLLCEDGLAPKLEPGLYLVVQKTAAPG